MTELDRKAIPISEPDIKPNDEVFHLEDVPTKPGDGGIVVLTAEEKARVKHLVRRIDLRMLGIVLMYIMNQLDRSNMPAARLKGFQKDLKMTDSEYSAVISILYVGYIFAQVPSNLLLNYCGRPSLYLPFWMVCWGIVSACTGICTSFAGAFVCRLVLGWVESPLFPGAIFVLSKWYTRKELAKRVTMLWMANFISNALNGLISAGILAGTDGLRGHPGWRWLFWIDGAMTIFLALCMVFIIPDFPHNDRWLSFSDRALAQKRLALETGEADEDSDMSLLTTLKLVVTDIKCWLVLLSVFGQLIAQSFQQFFPTIVATLGYGSTDSLLLTCPPWVFAGIVAYVNAYYSDKRGRRFEHLIGPYFIALIGFIIAATTTKPGPRYVSMFLMCTVNAGYLLNYPWLSAIIPRPPAKRAVAIAFVNSLGNLATVAGSFIFPTKWAPRYYQTWAVMCVAIAFAVTMALSLRLHLVRLNKKMDQGSYIDENGRMQVAALTNEALSGSQRVAEGNVTVWRYQL
ncbi:hypothetical protein CI109_107058 [Kwoniella shandongensis]|uniref:Uncharacterized protein n=1 Tax=Kwoniella shandongensis TaxID=1734106 RepID=A0A5M6BQN4_9TREE|nr:uncharacterized protein CI109_006467 [Kwoniella shandongensis]KAA5525198.1 hypothetical protein CI109_006467 [Kwoniella shandongensis]